MMVSYRSTRRARTHLEADSPLVALAAAKQIGRLLPAALIRHLVVAPAGQVRVEGGAVVEALAVRKAGLVVIARPTATAAIASARHSSKAVAPKRPVERKAPRTATPAKPQTPATPPAARARATASEDWKEF